MIIHFEKIYLYLEKRPLRYTNCQYNILFNKCKIKNNSPLNVTRKNHFPKEKITVTVT